MWCIIGYWTLLTQHRSFYVVGIPEVCKTAWLTHAGPIPIPNCECPSFLLLYFRQYGRSCAEVMHRFSTKFRSPPYSTYKCSISSVRWRTHLLKERSEAISNPDSPSKVFQFWSTSRRGQNTHRRSSVVIHSTYGRFIHFQRTVHSTQIT